MIAPPKYDLYNLSYHGISKKTRIDDISSNLPGSIISAIGMLAGSLWNKKTLRQDKGDPQGV